MVALVLSSLSCCLKMAKIKAKQAREPVLKKNWRPMNLGKSEEPLNSGPPPFKAWICWGWEQSGQQSSPIMQWRH